jgi:putative thioredoxin
VNKDVTESDFISEVVDRSRELPVVVDFWAEWCGPCRQLTPALEAAIGKRDGRVELVKVDVDANQSLAASFGVQGIPAVKAFRDGQVVAEFTGAIPPAQIERWLDTLVPSPADELAAAGDEESLRRALAIDPEHGGAAADLGKILLARGDTGEALELLEPLRGDFRAEGLTARARLSQDNADQPDELLARAFDAWDNEDYESALEALQEAIAADDDPERRDLIRRAMVGIFAELGADHELARVHRRRPAAALN